MWFWTVKTYMVCGDTSGEYRRGTGLTYMSSSGIFPALSMRPGVEELLGRAAERTETEIINRNHQQRVSTHAVLLLLLF